MYNIGSDVFAAKKLLEKASITLPNKFEGATWIPLTKGCFALVDDFDALFVNQVNWHVYKSKNSNTAYAMSRTHNILLHRFIGIRMELSLAKRFDHINRIGLDCRRLNLREATAVQNQGNVSLYVTNSSGYKGVSKDNGEVWRARIRYDGKEEHLGNFKTPEEAANAYDEAAIKHFGEFALTNKQIQETKNQQLNIPKRIWFTFTDS